MKMKIIRTTSLALNEVLKPSFGGAIAFAALLACTVNDNRALAAEIHDGVHASPAVILQVLKAFDNPEGAIFSADGRHVFISNAAEAGDLSEAFNWVEGAGYVSKLEVKANGELVMVDKKLIAGLTGPTGMGVLPVATQKFPAGTIFLCTGSAPFIDSAGKVVTAPTRMHSKLLAFNEAGQVLGEIDTGQGSVFEKINGSPIILINALGFDADGNVYVTDTAIGADQFEPPFEGKGGVWLIPHNALDALADGRAPADPPTFLAIPGNPDGVEVSPTDGRIYVNTVGAFADLADPANGGIYALTKEEIANNKLPFPVDGDLGALDGLDFTAGGVMLNAQIRGDIPGKVTVTCQGKVTTTLALQPGGTMSDLNGPADLAVRRRSDGAQLVVIPELYARDATPCDDEVTVLALPAGFEATCARDVSGL
jgi:sugar lactone lactonase YvrE